jgi:hypothetical protein
MGLRTPSRFKTFGAQAQAGAEKQKQARENLMQPGQATKSALGGRASSGTQMVANTTGAQQAATQKVQETQTQATKDLQVDPTKLGTATVTAIGGTAKPPPATTTAQTTPPPVEYTGGLSATDDSSKDTTTSTIDTAVQSGDVGTVETTITNLGNDITNITNTINEINDQISKATAEDAQKLQAEKDRLIGLRETYIKKRKEENLGQIAGQSQEEIDAQKQAILLAKRGPSNVSQLATVFGKRSAMDPALASQIYGKDLEALQGEAAKALSESERAKLAADEADKQYVEQIDASKKAYEEKFKDEDRKTKLLAMTPEELKGVTKDEVEQLFGKDMAEQLFDFNEKGYVSNAQLSKTREILEKNLTAKKELKTKAETDKDTAIANKEKQFTDTEKDAYGDVDNPGTIKIFLDDTNTRYTNLGRKLTKIEDVLGTWYKSNWSGISKDSAIVKDLRKRALDTKTELIRISREIDTARTTKDTAKMKTLLEQYQTYARQRAKEDDALYSQLTETARRL